MAEAKGQPRIFLYRVYAPSNWEDENAEADTEAGT
mgnify:CR=1 FL=1